MASPSSITRRAIQSSRLLSVTGLGVCHFHCSIAACGDVTDITSPSSVMKYIREISLQLYKPDERVR